MYKISPMTSNEVSAGYPQLAVVKSANAPGQFSFDLNTNYLM